MGFVLKYLKEGFPKYCNTVLIVKIYRRATSTFLFLKIVNLFLETNEDNMVKVKEEILWTIEELTDFVPLSSFKITFKIHIGIQALGDHVCSYIIN